MKFLLTIFIFTSFLSGKDIYIYNDYIKKLNLNCNENKCCEASVKWMFKHHYYLEFDIKNCKRFDLYDCKGSYEWCEDKKIILKKNTKNI